MAGDSAERAAALATRAIEGVRADPILAVVVGFATRCLTVADRLDDAERILSATIDDARRQQANYRVGPLLAFRSDVRFRAGALREAVADAEAALTAYAHAGRLIVLGSTAALVQALVERGEFEAAEAALEAAGAHGPPEAIGDGYAGTLLLNARARLRLAQGDARAALADALEVGRRQEVDARAEPRRGRLALARGARVRLARPAGPRDRAGARGARARPPLRRPAGDRDRAAHARRDRRRPRRVCTRPWTCWPPHRPGSSTPARSPTSASRCAIAAASSRLASRCARRSISRPAAAPRRSPSAPATELLIAGARPRRPQLSGVDALTTNERRVAAMAADGRSNREIAQALYVSHKTVEKHLTAAYRKLGVSARDELAGGARKRVGAAPHTPRRRGALRGWRAIATERITADRARASAPERPPAAIHWPCGMCSRFRRRRATRPSCAHSRGRRPRSTPSRSCTTCAARSTRPRCSWRR